VNGKPIARKAISVCILCMDDNDSRAIDHQMALESAGCEVLRARDEDQAVELLAAHQVDMVFVDSRLGNARAIRAGAKIKSLRLRIILICEDNTAPASFQEHVDVTVDESAFDEKAQWLITSLKHTHFPLCSEWLANWHPHASDSSVNGPPALAAK
jgi:DNA-binding NtrC family response regulator